MKASSKRESAGDDSDGDDGGGGRGGSGGGGGGDDDMVSSAEDEFAALTAALDTSPELRAAAPTNEVDGEILVLQYELLWRGQGVTGLQFGT
jgi:hypothetical protein